MWYIGSVEDKGHVSMTVWASSDWHLYHKNILTYTDRKFSSVDEMNTAIIDNMNSKIGPKDILFFLGDFAFAKDERLEAAIQALNFNTIWIVGNHDKKSSLLRAGARFVYQEAYITVGGKVFWLHHIPLQNRQGDERYFRPKARMKYDYALSGHRHSKPEDKLMKDRCLDVGIDGNHMQPYSIEDILDIYEANKL